jgi:hypothetical protein
MRPPTEAERIRKAQRRLTVSAAAESETTFPKSDALKGVHMSVGQQLGVDMATNFILMTLFSLLADMAEDPDGFRTIVKQALFDLTDNYKVPGVAPEIVKEAREAAKQVIAGVLQNVKPLTQQ